VTGGYGEGVFEIAGTRIGPGERRRLEIPVARLFTQTMLSLPVTVVTGTSGGPRLWLDAALHGDELNGAEVIRRVLDKLRPERLRGTVVAVPIVNVFGFVQQSRYLPDRRDLNRSFPGSARGSLAARLAHLFMNEVVARCTHGIDIHTGSHHRTNLPQVRANLDDPETARCARAFSAPLTIHAGAIKGSLRHAAAGRGIPILVYEAGEPQRFNDDAIRAGVSGVLRVMAALGMVPRVPGRAPRSVEVRDTLWERSPRSGILHLRARLGQTVRENEPLCAIADAFGDEQVQVGASCDGIVIGRTNNPLVHRGDAIVHLALTKPRHRRAEAEELDLR
jgi:hypothetical protein